MKIFERLTDESCVEILPHVKLDMPRGIDQQTPLQKEEDTAAEIYAQYDERIIYDLFPRHAGGKIVNRAADKVRHEEAEGETRKDRCDPGAHLPPVRAQITEKFANRLVH
jgi:hypothetical protein